ncbi:MAG: hypothetical protein ABI587_05095 [Gemmatimonadales bacterium]
MQILGRIFAGIGAGGILAALAFVSLLIGVVVHGMIILIAGKPIDDFFRKKGEQPFIPGSIR